MLGFSSSEAPSYDGSLNAANAVRMGHVIVAGNEKGGAGKSTLAMHVIAALARMDRRVVAIDLDSRQRTLTRYFENRAATSAERGAVERYPLAASTLRNLDAAAAEEEARFQEMLFSVQARADFIVIDAPGADTNLSRLAHAAADTLITPLNDSFIDFDLLGDIDPETFEVRRPSVYAEMVWESRKRKAAAERRPIDWVVLRNRLASSVIIAKNQQRVGEALRALSSRIGFRLAPGLSERVIYRELFPKGLTLVDLEEHGLSISHVAARQELRDLVIALKLPGLEGARLRF